MVKQRAAVFLCILILSLPVAYVSAGTIVSPHQYAWSNNVGYINFSQVIVSDSALSGYAWSTNSGFIKLNPAQGGVLNDGNGNLSGSAWGEQLGWIDFDNVSINSATGKFSGTATGSLIGTLTFACGFCDVRTDWRPAAPPATPSPTPPSGNGGGGGGGGGDVPTPTPTTAANPPVLTPSQARELDPVKDGVYNIIDFNALLVNWGTQGQGNPGDINRDGVVDIFDFNLLMVYWGTTYPL